MPNAGSEAHPRGLLEHCLAHQDRVVKHAIDVDAPVRENYLRGYIETANADEWETEIGSPIFRTSA